MRYNTMFTVTEDEKEKMADTVTDIITDEYEKSLIRYFINESYPNLTDDEIKIIEAYTIEERENRGIYKKHREKTKKEVLLFLSENGRIIPKGFVDFRMRDIYTDIKKLVFYGAERFFNEQEYEEFICLLKMFIEERESREKLIHVVFKGDEIRLLNKRGSDVTEKYEAEILLSGAQRGAKSEDLAVSAIISIAPEYIILHNLPKKSPLGATLQRLFGKNARVCTGCDMCKKG